MVPIANRPILLQIMKYYAHFGHKDFIICLGHKGTSSRTSSSTTTRRSRTTSSSRDGKQVELLASDIDDWRITFVNTGLHNNVGQRLRAVQKHLADEEIFLATYGDAVTDAPLTRLIKNFRGREKTGAFLCVRPKSYSFHTVALSEASSSAGSRTSPARSSGSTAGSSSSAARSSTTSTTAKSSSKSRSSA